MSIDNKVFPIYEGAQLRRRFTTEEEWKDWLRAHGAYGFRVAPYYSRCVVVFGADRYVETMKQLYGVDDSEFIGDAGGWVTDKEYAAEPVTNLVRGTVEPGVQIYTREELEAVADSEGIAGLRLIGGVMGVKAKGIVEMIDGILKAQGGV
ncbi:hypothetical protein Q2T75_23695 [Klebsiella variicola]|uniref:hypothetical protein n=1 Tax=Klebsiella variicola TaxID=244366 RepID=UPI00265FF419|nr:hypothetical protein [Klebsiella variicola]MDO1521881.1 hypothetical protein [Klebsiella variicola]MDO1542660.1 hypothetical protein [Klebsiella variicola]